MFKIGHYTDNKNITGCTVILMPPETTGSCYIAGSAPGTREVELLVPERKISCIDALLLTGGSAFGLNAAQGVVRFLEEKNKGYKTSFGIVPIVPAAVIYDLNIGNSKIRPIPENAYQACKDARGNNFDQGNIGVGTGATVGKWAGIQYAMKGGLGIADLSLNDAWVQAITVVNAVGDVVDENGKIIAGAINANKKFFAESDPRIRWKPPDVGLAENTVLSVIMTNVKIDKLQAYIISKKSVNGLARAIIPANTNYDGDIIFTFSNGDLELNFDMFIEMATEVTRLSVINSVKSAETMAEFLGYRDI